MPVEPSLTLVRRLKAPPAKVYAAWTEPERMARWWGPEAAPALSAEADVRPGGRFRVVFRSEDGEQHDSRGEYREVVPDERIVSTEVYEGMPEGESLNTATFTEVDGRTTLTILVQHQSQEHRDAHIASGMETGLQKAMDFLEGVARSLR